MKLARNRMICTWYRNGMSGTEIANKIGTNKRNVYVLLKKWYPIYFNTPYVGKHSDKYRKEFYEELYKKYRQYYMPNIYTTKELAKLMGCTIAQLNKLCELYNLDYQRLKIGKRQRTLCNVPEDFYKRIQKFSENMGFKSIRQFAVCAINEYILQYETEDLVNDTEY